MKNKKRFFSFLTIVTGIVFSIVVTSHIHAQQPAPGDQIPSDLSVDLQLAQQNPDPNQQTIVNSETSQAESVTAAGDTTTVQPQDTVAPQVKTEFTQDAIHPDQTTSQQVITTPVVIDLPVNQSGSNQNQPQDLNQPTGVQSPNDNINNTALPSGNQEQPVTTPADNTNTIISAPTGTDNTVVPGTTVPVPNDNAAPADNSTNPNLPAPTAPSDQQQINPPASSDSNSGNTNTGSSTDYTQQQPNPPASDNSGESQP